MKIVTRILTGKYKGFTIRKSIYGWYYLYSSNGKNHTNKKHTLEEIKNILNKSSNEQ